MSAPFLNHDGSPMKRADAPHAASDRFSREMRGWTPALLSADAAWLQDRDLAVARTSDLVRNNGMAAGAIQRQVDAVIGSEFRLSYRPDYTALGKTASWARGFAREVEAAFRTYAYDVRGVMDAGRRHTLPGLLGLSFRHALGDGESLVLPQWLERQGTPWRTCFQVIDPDRLSNPNGAMDTDTVRGGVEVDAYGAPIAYNIRVSHPNDVWGARNQFKWERVPRFTDWGRFRVLHHFEAEEAGQTRGKSRFVPVLERFKMGDRWARNTLQAALLDAMFAATIESPFDPSMFDSMMSHIGGYTEERLNFWKNSGPMTLDGARVLQLFPGEKFNFTTSNRPNSAYSDFERSVLRYIASGLGMSYEQLAQDWSQTNYSSARAAMLEMWKFLVARRGFFVAGVATPIFACWFEEAVDLGVIELPSDAPGFWEAFAAWTRCRWIGPARGWVDPEKEAKGIGLRLAYGVSTLQIEAAEQGAEWDELLEQQAAEQALRHELGLAEPDYEQAVAPPHHNHPGDEGEDGEVASHIDGYARRMERLSARAARRSGLSTTAYAVR